MELVTPLALHVPESSELDSGIRLTSVRPVTSAYVTEMEAESSLILTGMITGLKLSASIDDLARLYLATIQAIAYGTRHIIEAMNATGYKIDTLVCCGGGTKNLVFLQQHANSTNCRLIIPEEPEAVLLGSAMLGAIASGQFEDLPHAMAAMSRPNAVIEPQAEIKMFHDSKYKVFHRLYADQQAYAEIMS